MPLFTGSTEFLIKVLFPFIEWLIDQLSPWEIVLADFLKNCEESARAPGSNAGGKGS